MMRQQFEEWERARRMPPEWMERNSRGQYGAEVEQDWQAWQAAYRAGMERAADICADEAETGLDYCMEGAWACEREIRGEIANLHEVSRQPDSADATG